MWIGLDIIPCQFLSPGDPILLNRLGMDGGMTASPEVVHHIFILSTVGYYCDMNITTVTLEGHGQSQYPMMMFIGICGHCPYYRGHQYYVG